MFGNQDSVSSASVQHTRLAQSRIPYMALIFEQPLWAGLGALIVYALFAILHGSVWAESQFPYYNYLADALLHGQLALRLTPPATHDLSNFHGHLYLYWPPMPAIFLMPFIAIFGVHFNDILFTLAIGALNVALVAVLLRQACVQRVIKLSRGRRGLLVLCFALGSVHLTLAPFGRVWFTGQLIGFMCVALCYLVALRLRGGWAFVLAGLSIAAAFLTRNHMLFAGLWPACYLIAQHRSIGWRRLALNITAGLLPVVVAIGFLAWYNWARFGSILDNGLDYHQMAGMFVDDYRRYGAFHTHYLATNLYYQYIAYPLPLSNATFYGGSLFLLTPVFFAAWVGGYAMRPRWSMWALVGSIVLVSIPILLLMGTGWVQFGPRYSLDFMVPLLLLTAVGLRRCSLRLLFFLTIISMAQYLLGTGYFVNAI
jgi:hypothetical protein